MSRTWMPRAPLATVAALVLFAVGSAHAADYCGPGAPTDLFYNYYVGPVQCGDAGAMGAALYPCPRPTPPRVGETFITYQGLLPQEFLYHHHRTYYRYNGIYNGITETNISWR